MTGPEHYREAERLAEQADVVMNADYGWMGGLSSEERLQRRMAYLADAQVHATLALAAATALVDYHSNDMTEGDQRAWYDAASAQPEHHRRRQEAARAEAAEFANGEPA